MYFVSKQAKDKNQRNRYNVQHKLPRTNRHNVCSQFGGGGGGAVAILVTWNRHQQQVNKMQMHFAHFKFLGMRSGINNIAHQFAREKKNQCTDGAYLKMAFSKMYTHSTHF